MRLGRERGSTSDRWKLNSVSGRLVAQRPLQQDNDKDAKRKARTAFSPCPLLSPVPRFQLSYLVAPYTYRLATIHDQPIQIFDRDAHLVHFVTTIQSQFNPVRGLGTSSPVHRPHHLSTPRRWISYGFAEYFFLPFSRGKWVLGRRHRIRHPILGGPSLYPHSFYPPVNAQALTEQRAVSPMDCSLRRLPGLPSLFGSRLRRSLIMPQVAAVRYSIRECSILSLFYHPFVSWIVGASPV